VVIIRWTIQEIKNRKKAKMPCLIHVVWNISKLGKQEVVARRWLQFEFTWLTVMRTVLTQNSCLVSCIRYIWGVKTAPTVMLPWLRAGGTRPYILRANLCKTYLMYSQCRQFTEWITNEVHHMDTVKVCFIYFSFPTFNKLSHDMKEVNQ